MTDERFLAIAEVKAKVALGRSTLYEMIAQKKFPPPIRIGSVSRWPESVVNAWMEERMRATYGQAA